MTPLTLALTALKWVCIAVVVLAVVAVALEIARLHNEGEWADDWADWWDEQDGDQR